MTKTFVMLMVIAVAVGGCLGTSPAKSSKADGKSIRGGAASGAGTAIRNLPTTLDTPKVLKSILLGTSAGEPNIAVAPDGTIYVTPISNLYRSTDGGKTFKDLGTTKTSGHGDGDIAIDDTGRLHWLGLGGGIPYQYSDDKGDKFTEPKDLSSKTGRDREWIDARPEGTIYTSWRGAVGGQSVISVNVSFDNGVTWSQKLLTMSPDGVGGPIVHGPVPGQVYEAISTFGSGTPATGGKIIIARSADNGTTWKLNDVFMPAQSVQAGLIGFPTSIFPVVSVDQAGNLYVVFSADQQSVLPLKSAPTPKPVARFGVFITTSTNKGETWSPPRLLSSTDHAALMPWVAAGAPGRVAVTWYENTYGLPNDVLPDLWNVKMYESIDALAPAPKGVIVQLTDQPSHIGSICTSGTGCAGGRSLLDFFEVTLNPVGQPVVAWASSNVVGGLSRQAYPTSIYFGGAEGTPLR